MVADNVAERRLIRTGYAEGGRVEVLDGLSESDVFVIVGQTSLRNGSKVSVINAASSGNHGTDTPSS